jgi:excinuclease UvrABC nuclease subunit
MPTALLTHSLAFDPQDPEAALGQLPHGKAVFALYGENEQAEPYIGLTPDLRRRLERLLRPAKGQTKRLQLVSRVRRIAWRETGSEFESLLVQFALLEHAFGPRALERMKLRAPAFVRFHGGNPYPRLTITNKPSLKDARWAFGPFPSRAAAERYSEEMLKLFLLRRCEENLDPHPSHPGCVYSEMKMCLAPCYEGCTDARYAEEAEAVRSFLATRGESKLIQIRQQRDRASEELAFEEAARLHAQFEKVQAISALAPELVQPLSEFSACILQASAHPDQVSVFLYHDGALRGPVDFSTIGMRIQNEQSGSSSLYAQPMAIEAVPESPALPDGTLAGTPAVKAQRGMLESRMETVLAELSEALPPPNATIRQGHLALLTRWYYRPVQKRQGEICFPAEDSLNSIKSIRALLRGVGRVAAAQLR